MKSAKNFTTYINEDGQNALHFVAHRGKHQPVRVLVQAGVDPNKADKNGMTPLHFAAMSGNSSVAKELLACGANASALTLRGRSAADLARHGEHTELAALLDAQLTPKISTVRNPTKYTLH